jgi:hypothetical protein
MENHFAMQGYKVDHKNAHIYSTVLLHLNSDAYKLSINEAQKGQCHEILFNGAQA